MGEESRRGDVADGSLKVLGPIEQAPMQQDEQAVRGNPLPRLVSELVVRFGSATVIRAGAPASGCLHVYVRQEIHTDALEC